MKTLSSFKNMIEKVNNIVITTHIHPDADGVGSEIALCLALHKLGKSVICVNEEPLLDRYKYLDQDDMVISYDQYIKKYDDKNIDLFIITDTNNQDRVGHNIKTLVQKAEDILFIDHHPCPKELAAVHCIDTTVAATGEIVGNLIGKLGVKFNKKIALALYTSILIDTNSFRYPTVNGNTHRLVAKLIDTGVSPTQAYNKISGTRKVSYMQMLGTILSETQSNSDGSIVWLKLTDEVLDKFEVENEDIQGLVNYLLILDNMKIACMFTKMKNQIKVSLRSSGEVDVGNMAQALGGGGHNHSAATIIEDRPMDKVISEVVNKLELMLKYQLK